MKTIYFFGTVLCVKTLSLFFHMIAKFMSTLKENTTDR